MAMYYYASKISAIACGTRCKQSVLQKSRGQRDRDKILYEQSSIIKGFSTSMKDISSEEKIEISFTQEVSSPFKLKSSDISCNGTTSFDDCMNRNRVKLSTFSSSSKDINECSVLGPGGIMYVNGRIVSGPFDSLVDILVPKTVEELDKEFIFSFLLSSRLFIRPHELLGKLLSSVPEDESLGPLVGLLGIWTNKFPYDFRDERIMNHVKHIVSRCSNTGLEELVSEMLSALLNRLTDLEKHEEDLRACQNTEKIDKKIQSPTSSQFAQILCRAERKLAKHVGPEEFLQCSSNILLDRQAKNKWDQPSTSGGPLGVQDPKKTCNLETYLDWSARLRLFVCNDILKCNGIRDRSKIVELWSGVAQYCLLVGNYNSATVILESLESPPIARLKVTWSKLSTTCQQLDCMQRHAEGYGDLWSKQTIILNEKNKFLQNNVNNIVETKSHQISKISLKNKQQSSNMYENSSGSILINTSGSNLTGTSTLLGKSINSSASIHLNDIDGVANEMELQNVNSSTIEISNSTKNKIKSNDWVVIPVFSDIVKLALTVRENCLQKLPNGHINIDAFDKLAAIVGAFTKHMSEIKISAGEPGEYQAFCRHMQIVSTLSDSELMMASFDCEEPNQAEKLMYDLI
ncbi:ras-GEF domain-containing family member 1B [Condylostylus longicornis]|uniref:ras-GEF domain-containing family member 1B n=1 Tax=Condylostylus longicornis TaxID=2530218 RepID=UPI00244E1DB4|nr:ras-GEF domain-containing family member 1B [Condylostylus longicornis]